MVRMEMMFLNTPDHEHGAPGTYNHTELPVGLKFT